MVLDATAPVGNDQSVVSLPSQARSLRVRACDAFHLDMGEVVSKLEEVTLEDIK